VAFGCRRAVRLAHANRLEPVPIEHPAEKQALTDLCTQIEAQTRVPYGKAGTGLTQEEIDQARAEVAKDMGW
jgi:hypothetical protein